MATISELLAGTYSYLNRPEQGKLSLGQVLPILLDSIDFYTIDLSLSSENWLLKSHIFTPSEKDELVSAPGYSVPVSVEMRDINSTLESDWTFVNISNVTDIQNIGQDGDLSAAFYGTPARMVLSFDPQEDRQVEVKLWYEPLAQEPSALSDSPKLSKAFHTMLKLRTALACVPYCMESGSEGLQTALMAQLQGWEAKWHRFVNMDRNAGSITKRDFRGIRAKWNRGAVNW